MKQMIAPNVPVLERVFFGSLTEGFFRRAGGGGKIFYLYCDLEGDPEGCDEAPIFPVNEDGLILKCKQEILHPGEEVDVIDSKDLGITEIRWVDDCQPKMTTAEDIKNAAKVVVDAPHRPGCFRLSPPVKLIHVPTKRDSTAILVDINGSCPNSVMIKEAGCWYPAGDFEIKK